MRAANINAFCAELLIEELVRQGVDTFCVSPGSRSAPLATAVAQHPCARAHVHLDERSAAYFAVGYARGAGKPAAVICTSGTAAANFLPAVIEAAHACLPLIVLTADRPPECLDTGCNQTIDQIRIFGQYTRWACALPPPSPDTVAQMLLTTVGQAVYRATRAPAGPVHINCAFREPLAPTPGGPDFAAMEAQVAPWRDSARCYTAYHAPVCQAPQASVNTLAATLRVAERPLVVVGELRAPREIEAVRQLVVALKIPAFADVTSGLRLAAEPPIVPHLDLALAAEHFARAFRPDVVLHIGGRVTSKRLPEHLATHPAREYVFVADHPLRQDPSHVLTQRIEADLTSFCAALISERAEAEGAEAWRSAIARANTQVTRALAATIDARADLSEPGIARLVARHAPPRSALFLGNSMPIRDMDMFGAGDRAPRVAANRGASGIDGCVATAAGLATGAQTLVTAVLGDLAVLHDLNALALVARSQPPVILIAINNDGGGIFHFLPIAESGEAFEPFFVAPHGRSFAHAAAMFGLAYAHPATPDEFRDAYCQAIHRGSPTLIEATIDRRDNVCLHRKISAEIAALLEEDFPP